MHLSHARSAYISLGLWPSPAALPCLPLLQTKDTLTLRASSFGSKCELPDPFLKKVANSGLMDAVMSFASFKANKDMKKSDGAKRSRLTGGCGEKRGGRSLSRQLCWGRSLWEAGAQLLCCMLVGEGLEEQEMKWDIQHAAVLLQLGASLHMAPPLGASSQDCLAPSPKHLNALALCLQAEPLPHTQPVLLPLPCGCRHPQAG